MGCNFYTANNEHIGKRSAAGLYCWDCDTSLCKGGAENVHSGKYNFHNRCPVCGKSEQSESLGQSSVGRELGFNKQKPQRKTGVKSCSSFTWAIMPEMLKSKKIIDEYGKRYNKKEFLQLLEECPIRFYDSIGREFS